jgi:uncharacterized membrane protein
MEDCPLARVLHVLGVVLWIGGVAFVTLVLLPAVRRSVEPGTRVRFFEQIEARFASQARLVTLITGASGFYLVHRLGAWSRFSDPSFWWMHAMLALWLLFTAMLFVFEPLWLHRWFIERAARDPDGTFAIVVRLHRILLAAALITVAGAVAGSHGWRWGA